MIQFRDCLTTNGVIKEDLKEVIKKLLKNANKRKEMLKKKQMMQMIGLIRPMLIKFWSCIVGIIFMA